MSALKVTIEHIALNDGTPIPEGPFKEQISEMESWMTIGVAAVALDRNTNEIAARVYEFRRTGRHWASSRKLRQWSNRLLDRTSQTSAHESLTMKYPLTNEEADILIHTSNTGRYVGEGHALMALAKRGLLYDHGPQKLAGGAHYLVMSTEGREVLSEWRAAQPKPPKVKRPSKQFQAWRDYCEANGRLSFPEFLKRLKEGQYAHCAV